MENGMFDFGFIMEGEKSVGICLGYAFTFSHEHGVRMLARRFGFNEHARLSKNPIAEATIVTCPDYEFGFYKFRDVSYLMRSYAVLCAKLNNCEPEQRLLDRELNTSFRDKSSNLRTAWGGNEFGIRLENDDGFLEQLWRAFQNRDIVMFDRSDRRKDYSGLNIAIKSLASDDFLRSLIRGR